MQYKNKFLNIFELVKKHFVIPFCISFFTISLIINAFGLNSTFSSPITFLYIGLILCFIAFFLWFKKIPKDNKMKKLVTKIFKPLFLISLFLITIFNINFLINFKLPDYIDTTLAFLAIFTGIVTFYNNHEKLVEEINIDKNHELETKKNKHVEFSEKFLVINKIPILKNIIRWIYKEGWLFGIFVILMAAIFTTIRIGMPFVFSGSYIDETIHLFSGLEFFKTGHFSQLYYGIPYTRGAYVSFFAGLIMIIFGKTVFVAKFLPATIGIVNFFILFYISKKFIHDKLSIILVLILYTFIPWFIFDHFYIRMYVFYEFFILSLTALFGLILNNKKMFVYCGITFIILVITSFLSHDDAQYLILLYSSSFIFYLIFFKIKIIGFKYKLAFIISCFVALFFYIGGISLLKTILGGTATYTSSVNLKYYQLFFRTNLLFTVFFIISSVFLFFRRIDVYVKIILFSSFMLFCIHLASSLDLQLTRTIIYFLTIFYLVSCLSISFLFKIYKNFLVKFIIVLMVILGIVGNYPTNFLRSPGIPSEVNYKDYQLASDFIKNSYDPNNLILLSSQDQVNIFDGVRYREIYTLRDNKISDYDKSAEYYDPTTNITRNTLTNVPVLRDYKEFNDIINKTDQEVVLFIDQDISGWITPESWSVIHKRFNLVKTFQRVRVYELSS